MPTKLKVFCDGACWKPPLLREAISYCETRKDYISRDLFEEILGGEEDHIDWLEIQLDLIKRVGIENYTQKKI